MRIIFALLAALLLAGCGDDKPSPLLGEWDSKHTGSSIRLSEGGGCRYFMTKGGGMVCEWEPIGEGKARLTMQRGSIFVEGEITILIDELWFNTPSGGLDVFVRSH